MSGRFFECSRALQAGLGEAFGGLMKGFWQLREPSEVPKIDPGPSKLMVHSSEPSKQAVRRFLKALAAAREAFAESFAAL